jgi:NAD/NADP transhydrogenase alpha subunit
LVDSTRVWAESDILLKVRAPTEGGEIQKFKKGATSISFVYPRQNESVVNALRDAGVTSFAMDMIPRISRAQVFDALRYVKAKESPSGILTLLAVLWPILQDTKLFWKRRMSLEDS